jgi:ABC-type Mn2+/Zn2+ transport system ATPase subunit
LLDEPFAGVDTATEAVIFAVIDRLCAEGRTVVVATHDLGSLPEHFDQALVLQRRVIASESPAAVLRPEVFAEAYGGPLTLFHGIQSSGRRPVSSNSAPMPFDQIAAG